MKKILIIIICLILLVGCSDKSEETVSKEKIDSEIEYFSLKIADMLNNLNNISLQNYELISQKVSMSKDSQGKSGEGGSSQSSSSQSENSQSSGNSQGNDSQSGSSSGGGEGESSGGEDQTITITEMQNNSILTKDTENVDWDVLKKDIENINTSWSIATIDLYNAKIPNESIVSFSDSINQAVISIKNEDKNTTLINLANLYSFIPQFLESTSAEKYLINLENTKYQIFNAYAAATIDDWNTVNTSLTNAEKTFLNVVNDTEFAKDKEFKINKTYMLIKELQNSITYADKELFFLKYINLLENMNTLG